jgi:Flp pilus assembly protein TadD
VPALLRLAELNATTEPVVAEALLEQAITISPNDAELHRRLGHQLISMGDVAAGRAQLRAAAKLRDGAFH